MVKTGSWILFTALAILMGLYPAIYFLMDRTFGLLSSRPGDLLQNFYWNIGFYTHIILGGVALLIGWTQFSTRLRTTHLGLHRQTGKVYVAAALLSSLSGIGIGIFATGGPVAASGFILLGITWFVSTLLAYVYIREMEVEKHQKMMIYSYAACFAAVTLRIWLPLLSTMTGDFITAYRIVAWLCWVPNIIFAYFICRGISNKK